MHCLHFESYSHYNTACEGFLFFHIRKQVLREMYKIGGILVITEEECIEDVLNYFELFLNS